MRAGTDAAIAGTRACANRADMRARIGPVAAHAGAHADNRTGMAAGIHSVIADTGAGTDRADMGPRADTMAPDMRANADSQDIDARAYIGGGGGRSQQDERE
jgi:hypothetical protein